MEHKLYYICPNWEQPNTISDELIELETPLFENIPLNSNLERIDLWNIEDLMSLYSFAGERAYFSIDKKIIISQLIHVSKVNTHLDNNKAFIEYTFEDGRTYCPERKFVVNDWLNEDEINVILTIAKEVAPHLFVLKHSIKANLLSFEKELWG